MTHVIEHLRRELEDGKVSKKRNAVTTSDLRSSEIASLKKVSGTCTYTLHECTCMYMYMYYLL